ncbi:molybdopterin molybdotransferase MoeA [Actinoplanes sp. NBC_00393]|uniref:molybdopterin molybdotransferase MoeA n=1 Tax=Actinoplanes sp. NBC_00393 TaxID=2975953 RepID=UPI002E1F54E5
MTIVSKHHAGTPTSGTTADGHTGQAMPWAQARLVAHRLPTPLGVQQAPLAHAAGRTVAEPVRAASMLPGFDNAAMDGYAVRGPGPWRLVGHVLAGGATPEGLAPGEAVEIATGAPVPPHTDRVVPYEVAERRADLVCGPSSPSSNRRHIRTAGEYVQAGQTLLPAGTVLTAAALGLAASVGLDTVAVRTRPTVRILVTGDEIVTTGVPPHGKVRDAISPVLKTLMAAWNADVVELSWIPDHPATALTNAVHRALTDTDLTLVCGSSSVGPADGLHDALAEVGATVHIDGVACRPGHPQVLAQAGSGWLIGLPGNPFAALAAAYTLIQPLLAGLAARPLPNLPAAVLDGDVRPAVRHTRLVPVRWHHHEVRVIDGAHPGYLGPAAQADALAVIPPSWQTKRAVELLAMLHT